jgi:hypothetical protein
LAANIGVKKNPSFPLYATLCEINKHMVIDMNMITLGFVTQEARLFGENMSRLSTVLKTMAA